MIENIQHSTKTLVIVLKGYPRLSETFIAQEIRELELRGFSIEIYSLRHPYDTESHPVHAEIEAAVHYLPEYLHHAPFRVTKSLIYCSRLPGFWTAVRECFRDWNRDRSRNRIRRFGQALVLACDTRHAFYYAHFMHTPASVAYYASIINQNHWAISAHAKDIWTIENWEKSEKLQSVDWLVTCTSANYEHLRSVARDKEKVHLLYHGLDLKRFALATDPKSSSDSNPGDQRSRESDAITLLSVGRAVEKKGYSYLLDALAKLPKSCRWRLLHIGKGELLAQLRQQAETLQIHEQIEWMGPQPQSVVLQALQKSDLFVLPSVIGQDGDRDGLPNVLMEAQSQKLACLSTDISGIPELIEHGVSGWLVPQRDSNALVEALTRLITDHELRERLALQGYKDVIANFSHTRCITTLETLLNQSLAN